MGEFMGNSNIELAFPRQCAGTDQQLIKTVTQPVILLQVA